MNKDPLLRNLPSHSTGLVAGVLTTIVLAGCSGPTETKSTPTASPEHVVCEFPSDPAEQDKWIEITDPPLDISLLAGNLGVSEAAAAAGFTGPVTCEPGLALKDLPHFNSIVRTNGLPQDWNLDPECYTILIDTSNSNVVSTDFTVACAAVVEQPGTDQTQAA